MCHLFPTGHSQLEANEKSKDGDKRNLSREITGTAITLAKGDNFKNGTKDAVKITDFTGFK